MENTSNIVIRIALNEEGYLEKKSNSQLDCKTANAGSANYTKYGKWYGLNPALWCAMFICWIFNEAYGETAAKKLLAGKFSAACEEIRQNFIGKKQYHTSNPQIGDIIFFKGTRHAGANHIGIITDVSQGRIYTIEGNTSGGSYVIDNGGGVAKKSYGITYSKILGYGRPAYDSLPDQNTANIANASSTKKPAAKPETTPTKTPAAKPSAASSDTAAYTKKQFIRDVQSVTGAKTDGIAGPETLSKTITVSKTVNRKHPIVKFIQKYLNVLGYNCGTVDGIAGNKFDAAVRAYQKAKGCIIDGEITAGKNTWRTLLGLR